MPPAELPDEAPPVLGSWKRVYLFVLAFLMAVIAALYAFMRAFS